MSRTILYGADQRPVVTDDTNERLRALCLAAFGALKGLARGPQGIGFVEGQQLEQYRDRVAAKIIETLTPESVEKHWGIKLAVSRTPIQKMPEGVQ